MSEQIKRGGKRQGAGRKPLFKARLVVHVEDSTARKIRSQAKAKSKTLGELIDEKFM